MSLKLVFRGSRDAELFTNEISHSMTGALKHLLDSDPASPSYGFMQASFDGRPWTDTMWTRDAGVMLRELACYGYLTEAEALALCLIRMVGQNEEGYRTFPEHLDRGKAGGSGHELDGTASIVIGMVYLLRRISPDDRAYKTILEFLQAADSPIAYAKKRLSECDLIAGTGEFGGGCGIEGKYVNVVQNALVRGMLLVYAQLSEELGDPDSELTAAAQRIREGMLKYLQDTDGSWIWCVRPDTLQPEEAVLNHEINKGIAHLNDVTALLADVEGLVLRDREMLAHGEAMFDRHYSFPRRKYLFDRYGMWLQFDEYMHSGLTSPSYANGYAIQAMALTDRMEWLGKCVRYLAEATYDNITPVTREDKYWFYERMFAPDIIDVQDTWEGCGALNLVNVAEPLKAARMIAGVDCAGIGVPVFAPRLPEAWTSVTVSDWTVPTKNGNVTVNACYRRAAPDAAQGFAAVDGKCGYEFSSDNPMEVRFGPFTTEKIRILGGTLTGIEKTDSDLYYAVARPD